MWTRFESTATTFLNVLGALLISSAPQVEAKTPLEGWVFWVAWRVLDRYTHSKVRRALGVKDKRHMWYPDCSHGQTSLFLRTALRVQQICCDVQEKRPNHVNTVAKKIGSLMTARVSLGGWSKFSTLMVSPIKNGELFVQFWTCGFNPRLFSNHEMSHSSWGKTAVFVSSPHHVCRVPFQPRLQICIPGDVSLPPNLARGETVLGQHTEPGLIRICLFNYIYIFTFRLYIFSIFWCFNIMY